MDERPKEFDVFVRRHAGAWSRLARVLAGNREDAEDLLQEALLTMYSKWTKVEGSENSAAYARRILINKYCSMGRRRSLRSVPLMSDVQCKVSGDHGVDDRDLVLRMLRGLPKRQQIVLALRYLDDCPDDDIAYVLSCRSSTVRSLAKRGLDALRASMVDQEPAKNHRMREANEA